MAVLDWLQQLLGGGDPEAAGAAQASTAMQPWVNQALGYGAKAGEAVQPGGTTIGRFARDYVGQRAIPSAYEIAAIPSEWAPGGTKQPGDPAAIDDALSLALSTLVPGRPPGSAGMGIRAFHGSPHSFDRFDLGKIGTGEGNQTFGRGLYFSEAEPVAARYRETTAGLPTSSLIGPGGETLATGGPVQFADKIRLPDVAPGMDYLGNSIKRLWTEGRPLDAPSVIKEAWGGLQLPPDMLPEITAKVEAAIERAKPLLEQYRIETTRPGHMYAVNLNAKPEDFLQWDKPLGEQPPNVLAALEPGMAPHLSPLTAGTAMSQAAESPYAAGLVFNKGRGPLPATPADVSQRLMDMGIPGNRYLDQFSRASPQEGTHNYAVWDDKIIEILRKYGILPPVVTGGLATALGDQ